MARSVGVQFAIGAKMTSTVASTFATVGTKVKSLRTNLKELQTVSARAGALMTANARLTDAKAQHAASGTEKHAKELKTAEKAYRSAERAASKYNISVSESVAVHAKANTAIARTQASLERQNKFKANQDKRSELQGQMLGTAATFAAVAMPIRQAIAFESSFADVKKVVDFGGEDEEAGAQKDIRNLSEKTGLSAEGIANIYAAAGESGIAKTRGELQVFAAQASTMAVAFGISADDAGSKMASWQAKMGMNQAEVAEMADAINHLSNNMAATAADTSAVVERMGAVAKGAGLSAKSIAAMSATFVAASPNAEMAATGMKNFLLTLTQGEHMTNNQKDMISRLGLDPQGLAVAMQKDAEGTITTVMEALAGLDISEQGGALTALFGKESIGAI